MGTRALALVAERGPEAPKSARLRELFFGGHLIRATKPDSRAAYWPG